MVRAFLFVALIYFGGRLTGQGTMREFSLSGYAQGTSYHITYYAADSLVKICGIDSILNQLDSSLSLYEPCSLISQFNRSDTGIKTDEHLRKVVQKSLDIFSQTQGMFDITVKPLVQAWGFGVKPVTSLPDSAAVRSLLACVGSQKIHLKGDWLYKDMPCIQIDANGIAQGYSVDVLASFLEKKGIRNYLVEIGGEIRVRGKKQPSGESIRIGIEAPNYQDFFRGPMQRMLVINSGGLTTSGNYRKYQQNGSQSITHLIDPHGGYPVNTELISVTVWAKDAFTADGFDNALMAWSVPKVLAFVRRRKDMEVYLIYKNKDNQIKDTASVGFYNFIKK